MARILLWAERIWPVPGGAELNAFLLASALQARGHTIEVIATQLPSEPEDETVEGLRVRRVAIPPEATADQLETVMRGLERTRRIVAEFQPELMLLFQPLTLLMYYEGTRRQFPVTSVFSLHAHLEADWQADQLMGRVIRASDYVVSCSSVLLDAACRAMPDITGKSEVIRNALPVTAAQPAPLPWDPPQLLYLGRLAPEKNVATALHAFARIAPCCPAALLTICGDGPERRVLRALTESLGLSNRVIFTGWIPQADVFDVLNQATMLVAPSLAEGLPLVGVQALQMGRPIVAAASDGLMEVVEDGVNGFLVAPSDDAALAERMLRLLADHPLAESMGRASLQRFTDLFNWEKHVDQFEAMIARILSS